MSLSLSKIPIVQMLDPRIDLTKPRTYAILRGGQEVTSRTYTSTSYTPTSSVQFSCPPPNSKSIIDRRVRVKFPMNFKFTGPAPASGNLLQLGTTDAIRAYPISQVVTNLNVTLNNAGLSINMQEVFLPMLAYKNPYSLQDAEYSLTGSFMDKYQTYEEGVGAVNNPLGGYADSTQVQLRGAFPLSVVSNTPTSAEINFSVVEDLYLSPLQWGCASEGNGLIGTVTFDLNFSLGDLTRMWSHSGPNTLTSIVATFKTAPQMFFTYITPHATDRIPALMQYNYQEVNRFPTNIGVIDSGVTTTVSSSNIQVHTIPKTMYLFARRQLLDWDYTTTDTYAYLSGLSVNWNNRNGLFASSSPEQLYEIAVSNGCNLNWTQYSQNVGSVWCCVFGKDLPLNELECPGLLGNYQLQINATFTNINQYENVNFDFYCILVNEGIYSQANGQSWKDIGIVTKEDVYRSQSAPKASYQLFKNAHGNGMNTGGNFLDDVGNWFSNAYDYVKNDIVPVVKDVASVLPLVGLGHDMDMEMMGMGGKRGRPKKKGAKKGKKGKKRGGILLGGKEMSRKSLKSRMH